MTPARLRLDRLLANLGYGSRAEVSSLLRAGRVTRDGAPLTDAALKIEAGGADYAKIALDGEALDPPAGLALVLNKPLGVTCSRKEAGPLVYDLMPERFRRREPAISSVGRLDKDTSGLLLLTDDGALLHRLTAPKAHVEKRYRATLARPLRGDEGAVFAAGTLMLDGEEKPLLPARLQALGPQEALLWLAEGRYHQARRMFAALGNHVEALRREAIGALELPEGLEPGASIVMRAAEAEALVRA